MTREEFWTNVYFQHVNKDFPEALADLALAEYDRRFGEKKSAVEEDSDGWIKWSRSSGIPVENTTIVDLKFDNGEVVEEVQADWYHWGYVTEFRIHKD